MELIRPQRSASNPVTGLDQFGGRDNGKKEGIFSRTEQLETAQRLDVTFTRKQDKGILPNAGDH
jgi:hypothetical protein